MADFKELNEESEPIEAPRTYTVQEFFEQVAPGRDAMVEDLSRRSGYDNNLILPDLGLFCENESCNGVRLFEARTTHGLTSKSGNDLYVHYSCKNCEKQGKKYSVWVYLNEDRKSGLMYKYGELPEFGPPTPTRVAAILGAEKNYYFKGRRAERQGMGIAAFAYYRRVVENQKNKIFEEIIRTVKKVDPANSTLLGELEAAKKETQFSKAVESIRHGIPQALLIDGQNPLTLLHDALSEGLHEQSDEECLERATNIRIVLAEFADRVGSALRDSAELSTAVKRILAYKSLKVTPKARNGSEAKS